MNKNELGLNQDDVLIYLDSLKKANKEQLMYMLIELQSELVSRNKRGLA